jgi:adenylosuccinate synthase
VGGQWGSEGKGNLAFYLAPEYDLLVRTGAPNAGHKVRDHDGVVYTHRQLPSGTRATNSRLLLGAGAVIDVAILLREIADCAIWPDRLAIDPAALIIEQHDVEREAGLKQAIGSTGTGGGAALARRIEQRGMPGAVRMAGNVRELSPYIRESAAVLQEVLALGGRIFVEGTQGTGLSILNGSYPHVTSRDTTVGTLLAEAGVAPRLLRRVIVACRAYPMPLTSPLAGKYTTVAEIASLLDDGPGVVLYQHGNRAPWPEQRTRVCAGIASGVDRPITIRSLRFGAFGVRAFFCVTTSPQSTSAVDRGLDALLRRVEGWDRSGYLLVE